MNHTPRDTFMGETPTTAVVPRAVDGNLCTRIMSMVVAVGVLCLAYSAVAVAQPTEGEWTSRAAKELDATVKYTLRYSPDASKGANVVVGEWVIESSMPVPLQSWVDKFCDGNDQFVQSVVYRFQGTMTGALVEGRYFSPKLDTCTCPAKCRIKDKGGNLSATLSGDGRQVTAFDKVLYATELTTGGDASAGDVGAPLPGVVLSATGTWETEPTQQMDMTVVRLLTLAEDELGNVTGTYAERTKRPFPLDSWRDKYCGGADAWNMVEIYEVSGKRKQSAVELVSKKGKIAACSCPGKCRANTSASSPNLRISPDGTRLIGALGTFLRKEAPTPMGDPAAAPANQNTPPSAGDPLDGYQPVP
ncbi:MAG: hypothetical protein HUU55_11770 [Myxococcales bacterium]|nr:hypothetical protein [Myxococcales bacterium]